MLPVRENTFMNRIIKRASASPLFLTVIFFIFLYSAFFIYVAVQKYETYGFKDYDLAIHAQYAWNIIHGTPTSSIMLEMSLFGSPLWMLSFLTALLYKIFPSPLTFLVLQSIFLGAAAFPLFLLAREKLGERVGLFVALTYLFYPALWYANLFEYHPLVLSIPFLFLSFYYMKHERFWPFLCFILLSVLSRGDVSLVVLMLGIYAAIQRKSMRWILTPFLLGFGWIIIGYGIIVPIFRSPEIRYDSYYYQFGNGLAGIIRNILIHPDYFIAFLLQKRNFVMFLQLLFPVGFLSLFSPAELMIGILCLLQHLASIRWPEHTINFHYTAPLIPIIFISAVYGFSNLLRWSPIAKCNRNTLGVCLLFFSFVGNLWFGPIVPAIYDAVHVKKNSFHRQIDRILKIVPENAAVISTFEYLPKLSNRRYLYSFHHLYSGFLFPSSTKLYEAPDNIQYAMVNFMDPVMISAFKNMNSDIYMRTFFEKYDWGVVETLGNIVLFKKGVKGGRPLYEVTRETREDASLMAVAESLEVQDFNLSPEADAPEKLNITFAFRCKKEIKDALGMLFFLENDKHEIVYVTSRPVCYDIYPTSRWKEGELIKDHFNLFFPKELKKGEYSLKLQFYSSLTSGVSFVQTGIRKLLDENGNIVLGKIDLLRDSLSVKRI